MGRSTPRVGLQPTTQPRQVRAVRSVLRGRSADFQRGVKRTRRVLWDSNLAISTFQTPCHRPNTVLVRTMPGRWHGKERAPRWATTQPRLVNAVRSVLRGQSADFPRGEERTRPASRKSNAVIESSWGPCCRRIAVLMRSDLGRRRGVERALRAPTTQPRQVAKSALRGACSVGGRPIIHGAKNARDARHGIRTRQQIPLEGRTADLSRF